MEGIAVQTGQCILLLWNGQQPSDDMKKIVDTLLAQVGQSGKVQVEHVDRLTMCKYLCKSQFMIDCIYNLILKVKHALNFSIYVCSSY